MALYQILDIAASGLAAQRRRVEVLAQNIANAETTKTPEGGPYRRRRVVFESASGPSFAETLRRVRAVDARFEAGAAGGVRVAGISVDPGPGERRYLPDHPDADADGYVEFPAFNPVEDMVDLTAAVRAYQANLAVTESVREMLRRTIEIARG